MRVVEERFENRAGVIVEPASDRDVQDEPTVRNARRRDRFQDLTQVGDAFEPEFAPGQQRFQTRQNIGVRTLRGGDFENRAPLLFRRRRGFGHLLDDGVRADLRQLVERPQDRDGAVAKAEFFERAVQDFAAVEVDFELREGVFRSQVDTLHHVVNNKGGFDVRNDARRPDRVEVALHKLAIAPGLRVFAAPNFRQVVTLERDAEFREVLRRETSERNGQVETHPDFAPAGVFEAVELLVGFVASFAGENLQILENRGVDRAKSVISVNFGNALDQAFARNHRFGEEIAETFQGARLDQLFLLFGRRLGHGVALARLITG